MWLGEWTDSMVVVRLFTIGDGRLYAWRREDFSFANMQGIEQLFISLHANKIDSGGQLEAIPHTSIPNSTLAFLLECLAAA